MDRREIEALLENWTIGDLISYKQARKGVVNINWIIKTAKGRYVLRKISQFGKKSDLIFELDYLTYLKEQRFPYRIPAPIRTKDGEFILRFKGSSFWIYQYIEGRNVEEFGYSELKECARMMAAYHRIVEGSNLDNKKGRGDVFNRRSVLEELRGFRTRILRKDRLDRKDEIFLKQSSTLIPLLRNLNGRKYSRLRRYPLHRDINPENTLWNNSKLVGLIDFENVGMMNDTVLKDISVILQYSCRDRKEKHKLNFKMAQFFLREYKKYHRLSNKDIGFIPDIITAGAIEDFSYAYWMLVNDPKRARLYRLRLYSRIAQWFHENKAEIVKKLTN
jgi:homoserine kinase type II